jgi:GT2 family glycosyltransferase
MLSIIMPTYRRHAILGQTLSVLANAVRGMDAEIVVVNDDTTRLPAELITAGVRVFQNTGKGPGAARNLGAATTQGETLLFLDDDILIGAEQIEHLLGLYAEQPDAVFNANWHYPEALTANMENTAFGRYLIAQGRTSMRGWIGETPEWERPALRSVQGVGSYCLLMARATFERIGGYSSSTPISGDDAVLSARLRAANVPMLVTTHITLGHNEADRLDLPGYLDRQYRGAVGIAQAAAEGVTYPGAAPSGLKKLTISLALNFESQLLSLAQHWPGGRWADPLFERLVNLLYHTAVHRGLRDGAPA